MNDLTRIGVFYDGNFFHIVSNYYAYTHPRRARIDIRGLHDLIRAHVAGAEGIDARLCRVVDVHYFRGRFSADEAEAAGKLHSERVFEDVLVREGVTTHYLPMGFAGTEKGIDVWFALEAYERALSQRFDVCALVAGDSDYLPLVRKLNALGTRVMIVGWDFEYTDRGDRLQTTRTSHALLGEAAYPLLLSAVIDDETQSDRVDRLFLPYQAKAPLAARSGADFEDSSPAHELPRMTGTIQNLIVREAEGRHFGYITPSSGGDNLWFGDQDLDGVAFGALVRGDTVSFELGANRHGPCAKHVRAEK